MTFIYCLIVLDVVAFVLSTVDSITAIAGVDTLFDIIEVFSVAVFTVEWVCVLGQPRRCRNTAGAMVYFARNYVLLNRDLASFCRSL